jgi:hypothetical protein
MFETVLATPLLLTFALALAYLCEVTLNYMSIASIARESVVIGVHSRSPASVAGLSSTNQTVSEQQYRFCLQSVDASPPVSEACLNTMAQWRSKELLNSLDLANKLEGITVESRVTEGADTSMPRLAVEVRAKSSKFFGGVFSSISAQASSNLQGG